MGVSRCERLLLRAVTCPGVKRANASGAVVRWAGGSYLMISGK